MKLFEIEYDIEYFSKSGNIKRKHLIQEECWNIILTDYEISFTRAIDGNRINYYLRDIPITQDAKDVYNIMITEVKD